MDCTVYNRSSPNGFVYLVKSKYRASWGLLVELLMLSKEKNSTKRFDKSSKKSKVWNWLYSLLTQIEI